MPKAIYECDTCDSRYAAKDKALECHPAITIWYSCDDAACDYLYTSQMAAEICDHLEEADGKG